MKSKNFIFGLLIILALVLGLSVYQFLKKDDLETQTSEIDVTIGRGFNRMVNYLDLSPRQFEEFHALEQEYRMQLHEYINELNRMELAILNGFSETGPDKEKMFEFAHEIGQIQEEIKKLTINHFFSLQKLCTEEQAEKLSVLFKEMQNIPSLQRGRQWQQGRRGRFRRGQFRRGPHFNHDIP